MPAVRRDDRSARTIIAKLVVFLFVQDSARSNTNLRNVQVLLLGTLVPAKKFTRFFGIIFRILKSTSINIAFDTLDLQRTSQIRDVPT